MTRLLCYSKQGQARAFQLVHTLCFTLLLCMEGI